MTQITCSQTGSESTKLDLLSSCEPEGWLIREFTSLWGPVRQSVCQVAPSNVLETPRFLADARVITTGPLRRICYPPLKNNGSISCWAPTHCCEGGYTLETLGKMILNTHCCQCMEIIWTLTFACQLQAGYLSRCMAIIGPYWNVRHD